MKRILLVLLFGLMQNVFAVAYMAPNVASYAGSHSVNVNTPSTGSVEEVSYDPYFMPMYGVGVGGVIPIGGSNDDNSNQYGSQDTYQPSNVTNDNNGEVTISQ